MYADFIVPVPRFDKKAYDPEYPYELAQVWSLRHYEPPPFRLDRRFRDAFSRVIREYGESRIENLKTRMLPPRLVNLLHTEYVS